MRPRPGVAGTPPERSVGLLTAAAADNQEDASEQAPRPPQMLSYSRRPLLHRATKLGMSSRHPRAVKGPSWLPEEQHLPMLLPAEHSNMLLHVHFLAVIFRSVPYVMFKSQLDEPQQMLTWSS